ncbi:hypothetical protein [Halpernia frigidisoli]|uniref:Uncharacterized protein n=1 Tax=Halpernia frigidisoli TaxID=1125876 RepID=A0A1I3GFF5_9FLAO|nr:hypothetical protein [Halpernia frigidisoli]SFI22228.1 hypothetical protein SAMN05443292_1819 [Halpernia frigidisoli]
MKKIFSLAIVGLLAFSVVSCDRNNNDVVDQVQGTDTYSTAYDLNNVSFVKNASGIYAISRNFNSALIESDVVLIYRKSSTLSDGTAVWQSIPRTLFLTQGELDYDFDFSRLDILIKAGGTFDPALAPTYINNQTFRIVVVPAKTGKNASANSVDTRDYNAVARFYNIKDANLKSL